MPYSFRILKSDFFHIIPSKLPYNTFNVFRMALKVFLNRYNSSFVNYLKKIVYVWNNFKVSSVHNGSRKTHMKL